MNTNCLESKGKGCSLDYFEKNAYFHGKLMTARDMLAEQVMHEDKLYTVNRSMLGDGLVCGMETDNLRVENGKLLVDIKPGMGIDCCGRLVVVKGTGAVVTKEVKQIEEENEPGYPEPMYLHIRYKECLKEAVPVPGVGDACEEKCCYNRILEVFDVVYSSAPPVQSIPHDVDFPSESDYENDNNRALLKIARDYYNANLKNGCGDCTQSLIFLGAFVKKHNGDKWDLDEITTTDHLKVAYTNTMLYDIITRHATRFDNPHNVNAKDTGALISINNVPNDEGNIDLISVPDSSIIITPYNDNNSIMIGETHSARNDNPHEIKPEQIGAIASVNNVTSGNSNINLLSPDGSISVTPGIESINLSLSSVVQNRISYLEEQVRSMQRYLMDKSLKYKLNVFSEIRDRFGSISAGKIVERVKEELDNRIYTDPEKYLMLMKELWEREKGVSEEIKDKVTEESLKKYILSLEYLGKAIESGNVSQAAVAQDEVCEMAEWLKSAQEMVIVPDVIEKDIDDAKAAIKEAGLVTGRISEQFSELEPGTVIEQNPAPGTSVPVDSPVDLVSSTEVTVSVPDVGNLSKTDARLKIEEARLYVGKITEEQSSTSEPGSVIRQSPVAGAMVGINSPVDLVVAIKPSVSVPNVVNMDMFDARAAIEKAGLVVGSMSKEPSTLKPDIILKQNPEAGTSVIVNSMVDLVLSTEVSVSVPKVVDMNVSDAMQAIRKAGLVVGTISEGPLVTNEAILSGEPLISRELLASRELLVSREPLTSREPLVTREPLTSREPLVTREPLVSREPLVTREPLIPGEPIPTEPIITIPAGIVIRQNPAPGTIVPANSKVNLVISKEISRTVAVPNVTNMDISGAKLAIEKAGLVVGTIEPLASRISGKVMRQNPAPGTIVAVNSKVNLVVSVGADVTVPNITGLKREEAKAIIEDTGLTIGKETPTISKTKEVGTVSTQSPVPGVEKPEGSSVDIRIVAEAVHVPNVIGNKIDDATLSIENAGLVVGKIEQVISGGEPGTVSNQLPTEKRIVAAGSSVNLNVVSGPQGLTPGEAVTMTTPERMVMTAVLSATQPQEVSIVPNVVDKNIDFAKVVIEKAGLSVDNVTEVVSDLKPGTVLEQFPAADSQTLAGSKVDILVAVKEDVTVPDVTGLTLDEAKKRLLDSRLQTSTWFNIPSSEPRGITIKQEPAAGTSVEIGSDVSLWVSA
ncbi:MAG: PASTA domain-containing protein [ANME-2 cluster archaeon]|nr:PASTA domain-containing protein [ANME-2 cluster archaeon]